MTLSVTEIIQCSIFLTTECMSHFSFEVCVWEPLRWVITWWVFSRNFLWGRKNCRGEVLGGQQSSANAEATRSESATQQWQWGRWLWERRKGRCDEWGRWPWEHRKGWGDEIWVSHTKVAVRATAAEATSEDDGLENVGKADAMRSESATQKWQWGRWRLRQRVRTMALRTSERPRRWDLSQPAATQQWQWGRWPWERWKGWGDEIWVSQQPHNSGNEDGGLENVGKAEAMRSESASSHTTVAMRTVALRTLERPRWQDLSQPAATQQWQWGRWPWERWKGRGDEIWVRQQPHNSGNEDGGLENVGKAEVTRSESASSHTTVAMRTVALRTLERPRRRDLSQPAATQQWQWGRWPWERWKGRGNEIWVSHTTVALRTSERPRRRDLSQPHE